MHYLAANKQPHRVDDGEQQVDLSPQGDISSPRADVALQRFSINMLHKELLRKLRMPDCLIVLGQEEGAYSSKLTDYRLLVAHLVLQLQGVLGLEAFYSQHLVDSLELQLVVGVMVMGADIGEGDSGEMDVAGPPFAKGLLHLLLDLHLDEVEEVVLQLASLLLGHLQVILVLAEEELTLVREVRAHPARSTLLADLLQKVTAQILHASLNLYALFDSSDFTFPLFETSVACVVLAALVRKIKATFSIAHVVAQSQVTV